MTLKKISKIVKSSEGNNLLLFYKNHKLLMKLYCSRRIFLSKITSLISSQMKFQEFHKKNCRETFKVMEKVRIIKHIQINRQLRMLHWRDSLRKNYRQTYFRCQSKNFFKKHNSMYDCHHSLNIFISYIWVELCHKNWQILMTSMDKASMFDAENKDEVKTAGQLSVPLS